MQVWLAASVVMGMFVQNGASSPSLEGTVFNKLTGAPVKNAHVMYIKVTGGGEAPQPISTDTDSAGRFAIKVQAGSYRLWAERPGYARQVYGSHTPEGSGIPLTLAPGQQVRDLEIKLTPLGAIAGSIFDEDGDPLQGVGIQVLRFSYSSGHRQLIPLSGASTNDRGEYRAYNLPAGHYLLLATPRSAPLSSLMETASLIPQAQEPLAALYYPGVLDSASASEVSLGEGAEITGIDFRLPKIRAVTVRGRLISPIENFAGSELQISLAHNDGATASDVNRAAGLIDKNSGRFEFRAVSPGPYLLAASQIYRGRVLSARVPVDVSSTAPENLTITLSPAFDIEGRVEVEQGTANFSKLNVRLVSIDGLTAGPPPASAVAADGSLRLAGVTPGAWDLLLDSVPEGLWIKTAKYGADDILRGHLNIPAAPPSSLHIVLAGNGAQISGTVTRPDDSGHATVVLAPASAELRRFSALYRVASTQEHGVFLFKGVRPGTYTLFAFEDVEPFVWLDLDLMKKVEPLGETFSVAQGERIERQLNVISPEALLPER